MAGAEIGLATRLGSMLGWSTYSVAGPGVARLVTFDGLHFHTADIRVPAMQLGVVLCGVLLVAAGAAVAALRRVRVSPLGVVRRGRRGPPGLWRVAVPATGMLGFACGSGSRGAQQSGESVPPAVDPGRPGSSG